MVDRREAARVLREIGALLMLKGENPFKTRAYETAAARLEDLTEERFLELVQAGALDELPGVGEAISKKVATLFEKGTLPYHDELRAEFPPGILDLLRVPDLGPKKAAALWHELKVGSIEALEAACREGRVRELKGFGEKTEARLLANIASMPQGDGRRPLGEVRPIAREIAARLAQVPLVLHAEAAGSVRRFRETVNDADIIVAAADAHAVFEALVHSPAVGRVIGRGDTKCSVVLRDGLQVDVRVVPGESWATALHHFTGSKAHHVRLRSLAREKGLTISEWGVETLAGGEKLPILSEADLYAALGLPFVPPEMREDQGEVEAGLAGKLPRVVEPADLQGFVHVHTRASDGEATILEMAQAAASRGASYLTITDHSRSAGYAGGLSVDRIKEQWDEIAEVQALLPQVSLLKGSEVDILEDGSLDYPDEVLAGLDVVVASVHSRFKMDEEAMTARLCKALDNPFVGVLGHATGRLIGKRPPYAVKLEAVFDKAARQGVAIEVNGNPERLDLSAEHARAAIARGVKLVLTTDAHTVSCLSHVEYAVATARRGWVRREDVLNCLPAQGFLSAMRARR